MTALVDAYRAQVVDPDSAVRFVAQLSSAERMQLADAMRALGSVQSALASARACFKVQPGALLAALAERVGER